MKMIEYKFIGLFQEDKFFARWIRKWVLCPESDKALTEEVKAGKWPEIEVLMEEVKI